MVADKKSLVCPHEGCGLLLQVEWDFNPGDHWACPKHGYIRGLEEEVTETNLEERIAYLELDLADTKAKAEADAKRFKEKLQTAGQKISEHIQQTQVALNLLAKEKDARSKLTAVCGLLRLSLVADIPSARETEDVEVLRERIAMLDAVISLEP